jgi:hypothetical protein
LFWKFIFGSCFGKAYSFWKSILWLNVT